MNLTPAKYWRISCPLDLDVERPTEQFVIPERLANHASPPARGHGLAIAGYDEHATTGLLRWVGIITGGYEAIRTVSWNPTRAEIFVDTAPGRRFWKTGDFGFAKAKIADYGLHELWQSHFEGLELRDHTPSAIRPRVSRSQLVSRDPTGSSRIRIAPERLNPIEVIGEPTTGPRAGVVYVLSSAYGHKVGRIRSVPARMRAFGVQLPFLYTVRLCAWFDDCHEAERRYHLRFADKRINGEWFDLQEADIEAIRLRV